MLHSNKIRLSDIKADLCKLNGTLSPEHDFDILWTGWTACCVRNKLYCRQFFTRKKQDGWLNINDARHFCNYINPKWTPHCIQI